MQDDHSVLLGTWWLALWSAL